MKISGVATLHAPPHRVWAALTDPAVLVATIPGCEQLEPAGPDHCRFAIAAAVASTDGSYTGEAALSQRQEPSSFMLTATGAGGPGTVGVSMLVSLAGSPGGTTEVSYDADAEIGGLIAGVGQRVLSSVAKRMASEFFSAVDDVLSGPVSQPATRADPGPAPVSTAPGRRDGPPRLRANAGFARGVVVGVAVTLAGAAVGALIARKAR
jgi:uncharacterized protein